MKLSERKSGRNNKAHFDVSFVSTPVALLVLLCLFSLVPCDASVRALSSSGTDSHTALTETREGRLAVFDDVWETIRSRYYDPSFHGIDWPACREEFRPLA